MYASNKEDRRDLFQEILIQLWKAYPKFRNESKITTWMYRVALNTAISQFRKSSRKPAHLDIDENGFQIADNVYDYEYEEKLRILQSAITQLSKIEKAIVMLYLEDKPYTEIADTIGITENNLRVKLNRIKTKLKKMVNV
jgi:RNA polymerase sigma-70 factor, ECF subfamily